MISYYPKITGSGKIGEISTQGCAIRTTYGEYAYWIWINGSNDSDSNATKLRILRTSRSETSLSQADVILQTAINAKFVADNTVKLGDGLTLTMYQTNASYPHCFTVQGCAITPWSWSQGGAGRLIITPTAFKLNGRNFAAWCSYAIEDDGTTE